MTTRQQRQSQVFWKTRLEFWHGLIALVLLAITLAATVVKPAIALRDEFRDMRRAFNEKSDEIRSLKDTALKRDGEMILMSSDVNVIKNDVKWIVKSIKGAN